MSTAEDFYAEAVAAAGAEVVPVPAIARAWFPPGGGFVPPELGTAAERDLLLRLGPDGSLWHDRDREGVFRPDGDQVLGGYVREQLGDEFRRNRLAEVVAWCRSNAGAKLPTQPSEDFINVKNGILYWKEDPPRLEAHDPALGSIIQLPVEWNPAVEADEFVRFCNQTMPGEGAERAECSRVLVEAMGYTLIPSTRMKKAFLFDGPTNTAKSTLLRVWDSLLGERNVSSQTLQALSDERFAGAELYGRLANICADLDAKAVQKSGRFKMLVSGDAITVERKYRHPFVFRPHARLIFSANEAPATADQSDAYYDRWLIMPMIRQFAPAQQDRWLIEKLTTPAELSGILNYAVKGLRRLWKRHGFDEPPVMVEASRRYRAKTDTLVGFVQAHCVLDPSARERSGTVYADYEDWCRHGNRRAIGRERFIERMGENYPVEYKPNYSGHPTWAGIRLRSEHEDDDLGGSW